MPDNLPPGVICLNGPQPQRNNNVPPPPPLAPMHQGDQAFGPMVPPPMGMPPRMQQPMNNGMHQQQAPFHPAPLPAHLVPADLRPREKVEVFDTRTERLTDADMREYLSSYFIIRLEKASSANDVDEEGYPLNPTWQRATRTEIGDMSKEQATRKVRDLERRTGPVADKKSAMSSHIQRQIEVAQERLEETEPDQRFCYILAQLDDVVKRMEQPPVTYMARSKKGRKSYSYTEVSRKSKSKQKERVSVTAYFKRTPRQDEDPRALTEELARNSQVRMPQPGMHHGAGAMMPGHPLPLMGPVQPMNNQMQPMNQIQPFNQMQPMNHMPPMNMQQGGMVQRHGGGGGFNGKSVKVIQEKSGKQDNKGKVIMAPGRKSARLPHGSPRSSKSSMFSDESWSADETDLITPESSVGSSSRYSRYGKHGDRGRDRDRDRDRSRGRSRHRDRPEHFGLEVPRRHSKHDGDFGIQHLPRMTLPAAPVAPRPLPVTFDAHRLLDEPYYDDFDGRIVLPRGRVAVQPAPVHARPAVRRLPEYDARREIAVEGYERRLERIRDDMERVQIEDDYFRDREYQLEQDAIFEREEADALHVRRMQDRLRRDEPWSPIHDRAWPERDARQYMHRRERSVSFENNNPFAPVARRASYYVDDRRL